MTANSDGTGYAGTLSNGLVCSFTWSPPQPNGFLAEPPKIPLDGAVVASNSILLATDKGGSSPAHIRTRALQTTISTLPWSRWFCPRHSSPSRAQSRRSGQSAKDQLR